MSVPTYPLLPSSLGFGIGFRPSHYQAVLKEKHPRIDWLEVISENFMGIGGKPRSILEHARSLYPIAIHGVGLSIGSPEPFRDPYLHNLKDLVTWLKPSFISDHLCFTSFGRHNSHDLLPLPYTVAMLDRVTDRIHRLQDLLGQQFLLENPSAYVAYEENHFSEADFFAELITRTGCGILLDVNNLFVNQMNLGLSPTDYLKTLPEGSAKQMHLAGHTIETNELGTVRIDTHDHPVCDDVWNLYESAIRKFPNAAVMIEWDDKIPELDALLQGVETARALKLRSISPVDADAVFRTGSTISRNIISATETDALLKALFDVAVEPRGIRDHDNNLTVLAADKPVCPMLGARVYNGAYFARLRDVLKDEFPTLSSVTNDDGFNAIVSSYLQKNPPSAESVSELGVHLETHLRSVIISNIDFGVPQGILADLAALDRARSESFTSPGRSSGLPLQTMAEISAEAWEVVRFGLAPHARRIHLSHNAVATWETIHAGNAPSPPVLEATDVLIWRQDFSLFHAPLSLAECALMDGMARGQSFALSASQWNEVSGKSEEVSTGELITALVSCFERGVIHDIFNV